MPETTAGFGLMIEPHEDEPRLAKEFAQMTIDALAEARREPDLAEARRTEQIQFARNELFLALASARVGVLPVRHRAAELLRCIGAS